MALRVLIVDDADMYRLILQEMVREMGHEPVGEAETGEQALERFKALKPDLVTLDLSLPDMDGFAVLREIRRANPRANVVMISGNDQDRIVAQARTLGALGLLVKPVDQAKLAALLRLLDGGKRP
ncbi:MAG TPA: two-component system response regulator [Elusimicrobia bacterium]|nr:two-component system response regulator [Elusimicrobiota bacterium]